MEFEGKPVFPPPLIILSHIHRVIKYFLRRWKGKPLLYDNGLKLFLDGESLERLHDFEEECMDGYNREKDQREQMSTEVCELWLKSDTDLHQYITRLIFIY